MAEAVPRKVIPSEAIGARIGRRDVKERLRLKVSWGKKKKSRLKCPYQDSNLGRRGFAIPQHDDLTTNLYGPESNSRKYTSGHNSEVADRSFVPALVNGAVCTSVIK